MDIDHLAAVQYSGKEKHWKPSIHVDVNLHKTSNQTLLYLHPQPLALAHTDDVSPTEGQCVLPCNKNCSVTA